jgi:hypothetical protein
VDDASAQSLLGLAEELAAGLRGLDREEVFARLEAHEDELGAALAWFVEAGHPDEAIRLTRSLAPFWQATRRLDVATASFERALALDVGTTRFEAARWPKPDFSGSSAATTPPRPRRTHAHASWEPRPARRWPSPAWPESPCVTATWRKRGGWVSRRSR